MTSTALYNSLVVILCCVAGVLSDYSCICNYAVEKKVLKTPDISSQPIGYLYEFDCKNKLDKPGIQSGFAAIAYQHHLGYVSLNEDTQEQICQGSPPAGDVIIDSTSMEAASATTTVSTIPSNSNSPLRTTFPPQASTTSVRPSNDILTVTTPTAATLDPIPSSTIPFISTSTLDPSPSSTIKPTSIHIHPSSTLTASSIDITTSFLQSSTHYQNDRISSSTYISPTSSSLMISTPSFTTSGIAVHSFSTPTLSTPIATGLSTPSQTISVTSISSTVPTTSSFTTTTADLSSLTTSSIISTNPSTTFVTTPSHSSTNAATPILSPTATLTSSPTVTMAPTTSPPTITTTVGTTYAPKFANVDVAGSDLRYIGIGYNLLAGNPGGMDNGSDPGLLLSRRVLQLSASAGQVGRTAREVDHILLNSTCISKHYFIHDGGSYQKELLQSVHLPNSELNAGDAFVFNKEFLHARHDFENNQGALYRDQTLSCSYEKLRYREELANASQFMISREFAGDVCKLPASYDATAYFNFISKWGTDIVMGTTVGTRTLSRYRTSRRQLLQQAYQQAPGLFHPTGIYQGYPTSVTFNSTPFDTARLAIFGSQSASYSLGSNSSPAPLHITLSPIWSALDAKYWSQVLGFKEYMDICPDNIDERFLNQIAHNIELAVRQYPAYKRTTSEAQVPASLKNEPITIPMTWPDGTYGLMQAVIGCPGSSVDWHHGYRFYDTEDAVPKNKYSSDIRQYLAGTFARNNLQTDFCIKTANSIDPQESHDWPSGTFCILRKSSCPAGFQNGYIYWDDDDINHNRAGGTLPDGEYNKNTKIYYCCRNDGPTSTEIFLPRDRPFILIRYKTTCQAVYGMNVHEVFVHWDDEDALNKDSAGGAHPYDNGGRHNHELYFCYYSAKQHGFVPSPVG